MLLLLVNLVLKVVLNVLKTRQVQQDSNANLALIAQNINFHLINVFLFAQQHRWLHLTLLLANRNVFLVAQIVKIVNMITLSLRKFALFAALDII